MTPGYDTALVRMDPTGEVIVTTGTCGHGQGHETTFAQIVADRLGVHPDQVKLRQGDTDLASTAAEMCAGDIVHLQTPSAFSETGAKGMGEGGTIGAPAAVLNAINDALSDMDVRFDHIPVLPHELSAAL